MGPAVEARIIRQPGIRYQLDDACDLVDANTLPHLGIGLLEQAREFQQYMILDQRERRQRVSVALIPGVMEIEGSAMIDEPQPPMPHQHIDVARGSIDIANECV